jgi:NADH:ubiquinone oxidoreductase subunit C
MADATTDQISDLRADVGDAGETVFSDEEIQRIWTRVSGASNEVEQHEAALALMFRQLMAQATTLVDHTAGDVEEKTSQLRKQFEANYKLYKSSLEAAVGTETRQFSRAKLRGKPRQDRTTPNA